MYKNANPISNTAASVKSVSIATGHIHHHTEHDWIWCQSVLTRSQSSLCFAQPTPTLRLRVPITAQDSDCVDHILCSGHAATS